MRVEERRSLRSSQSVPHFASPHNRLLIAITAGGLWGVGVYLFDGSELLIIIGAGVIGMLCSLRRPARRLIFGTWVAWIIWAAIQTWRENNRGYDEWLPDDDERRKPSWRRI